MSREWRRCGYTSLVGFGGFGLKTIGGRLVGLAVKTRCGWFGGLGLKTTDGRFLKFGPQNLVGVPAGTGGGMWHHCEACAEAKQSRKERVAIGCTNQDLDHFAPRVKWFSINI